MITQEQAERIIASNYLRDAVELLGGTIPVSYTHLRAHET